MNDYIIVLRNFEETHRAHGKANFKQMAFEDTVSSICKEQKNIFRIQAVELLNRLIVQNNEARNDAK